jgi:peptidoglycan/xylan/chitin deacetylase (PgdA/CDA1 family)
VGAMTPDRYELVRRLGLPALLRRYHRTHALILAYHGVVREQASPARWTEVALPRFREQMGYLRARYRLLPLLEIVERLSRGAALPRYAAAITLDDGYCNNFTCAFPVLRELRIPATIFLTTGFLDERRPLWTDRLTLALARTSESMLEVAGHALLLRTPAERRRARDVVAVHLKALPAREKDRLLDTIERALGVVAADLPEELAPLGWDDVRAMRDSGLVDFGSHTVTHQIVSRLGPEEKAREIAQSCRRVEEETGGPCRLFAYPNGEPGDFDEESRRLLHATSVVGAVTTVPGLVTRDANVWALPRVLVGADASMAKFDLLSSGFMAVVGRRRLTERGASRGAA